jgi:hypothetical protein
MGFVCAAPCLLIIINCVTKLPSNRTLTRSLIKPLKGEFVYKYWVEEGKPSIKSQSPPNFFFSGEREFSRSLALKHYSTTMILGKFHN